MNDDLYRLWKRAVGDETIDRVRQEGAAVAFGLMGMAEAIREKERAKMAVLSYVGATRLPA